MAEVPMTSPVGVLCVLQARMSSTRLPGKVLRPILGRPMLEMQIERIRRAKKIGRLVVATSMESSDQPIAGLCKSLDVDCYQGSLGDVLDRYYQAARAYRPQHVMRLTGDCPLTDPALLDALVDLHLEGAYDYSANVHERTYPDGLDAEIFRFQLLEEAWTLAKTSFEREHVTPYMYRTGPAFNRGALKDTVDRANLRWTVDHPEDLEFVSRIFEALYPRDPAFDTAAVHAFLESHPDIQKINAHLAQP